MPTFRPLDPSDYGALHRLYTSMSAGIPHHFRVGEEQFSEQLLGYGRLSAADCVNPGLEAAFVAERAGEPIALALTTVLAKQHEWGPMEPGTGILRFLLAPPGAQEQAIAAIRAAQDHLAQVGAHTVLAMHYIFGPVFHNTGCAMLPAAWPWLGHWLFLAGFRARSSEIRLRRPMKERPEPLELPAGSELREHVAEGRALGAPANLDEWDLYIDGENAAQCHNAFGENYVRGAGHDAVHTEWLGVAERFRGRGLARAMLRLGMVRAWDRGSRVATLTTAGINFRAQALYITEGYAQTDTMWDFHIPH